MNTNVNGRRIPNSKKLCAWTLGQLMLRLIYRSRIAEQTFFAVLGLFKKNAPYAKQILGQRLSIDPYRSIVDLRLCVCGIYEPDVAEYFISRLLPEMTVIDIGANIGYFTLLAADLVGPTGKVVCYEPNPTTFDQLQRNIALNPYTNIVSVQSALSDVAGKGRISVRRDSALNTFALTATEPGIDVQMETLDDSLRNLSIRKCDLVKMDIEGAEFLAVQGMEDTIARNPNIEFVIEVHPLQIEKLGGTVNEFLQFFVDRGFKLFRLGSSGELKPFSLLESRRIPGHIVSKR